MIRDIPPRALSLMRMPIDDATRLESDRQTMMALSNHLKQAQPQRSAQLSVPVDSTPGQWLLVYHKACQRPGFLAWAKQQALNLSSLTLAGTALQEGDGARRTFTFTHPAWRRLATPIVTIAEIIDPSGSGLPWSNIGQSIQTLTVEQLLRFYGFPLPESPAHRFVVISKLEQMLPFETAGLNDDFQRLNEDLQQLAQALETLVRAHYSDIENAPFDVLSPYKTRLRLRSNSCLSRTIIRGATLLDIITHHPDFLARYEGHDLQAGNYAFHSHPPMLKGEQGFGLIVDIDPARLRTLIPNDSVEQLINATAPLHIPIHQTATLSVAELLIHHGLPRPATVEQADAQARLLRRAPLLTVPSLNYRAASAAAIAWQREQRVIDYERDKMLMALNGLIAGKAAKTSIAPESVWVEPEPDHCATPEPSSLEALLKRHGMAVVRTVNEARGLLPLLQMARPASHTLGSYWRAVSLPRWSALQLSSSQHSILLATVARALPLPSSGLFNLLAEGLLPEVSREEIRANADMIIQQMLDRPFAQTLGTKLIEALGWYGHAVDESITRDSRNALVLAALILTLDQQAGKQRYVIAGLDFNTREYWGLPYPRLREDLELRLVSSGLVSVDATPVATHLLLAGAAPECLVQDIPDTLNFMTAHAWMLFKQGVMQVEDVARGSSRQMTFNDIVVFASQVSASVEQQQWRENCALSTLIDWSVANGALPRPDKDTTLSLNLINRLKASLDSRMKQLNTARRILADKPPSRRAMALKDLRKVYPDNLLLEKKCLLWRSLNYTASYTRLGPGPKKMQEGSLHSAVDLHMSGALIQLAEQLQTTDPEFDLEGLKKGIAGVTNSHERFTAVFADYIGKTQAAYGVYIQYLLCQLRINDREDLQHGHLQVLILTAPATTPLELELPRQRQARTGRYGLILRCERGQTVRYFELFPLVNSIRENRELPRDLLIGGQLLHIKTGSAHAVQPVTTLFIGTQLPVDWQAYATGQPPRPGQQSKVIVERLFNLPAQANLASAAPMDFDAPRTRALASDIVKKHFFLEPDLLFAQAQGASTLEEDQQLGEKILAAIKVFVPFWSCSEDLASGDTKRTIDGAYACFLDVLGVFVPTKTTVLSAASRLTAKAPTSLKLLQLAQLSAGYLQSILNPLDGVDSLLKLSRHGVVYLSRAGQRVMQTAIDQTRQWLTHTPAFDMFKHLKRVDIASGTVMRNHELTRLMAIMHKNRWRPFEPFSARPQGPTLNDFIPDNAIPVTTLQLTDGYQARVAQGLFDSPLILQRSSSTDILTGGKILRLAPNNPALLTDLTSASHFRTAQSLDNLCTVSRTARSTLSRTTRSPIPLICFTKTLLLFRNDIHKQRVQAMEHLRLIPAGQTSRTVYNRLIHEATPQVTGFELTPVAVQLPVTYKKRTSGRFILDEPQFGLSEDDLDNLLNRETAVVEVHAIVDGIDDRRVMRALLLNEPSASTTPRTRCVIECDVGVFYEATAPTTGNQALQLDLLEYGTSAQVDQLIQAYATQKNSHVTKAGLLPQMPLVVLPTLEVLYRQLSRRGYTARKIELIFERAGSLPLLKQREFLLNTSDQGRRLDIQVAALPVQLQVWPPHPHTQLPSSLAQINQHMAETAKDAVQALVERTGLRSANIAGNSPDERSRLHQTEAVVMWEYSKVGHPDYTEVILRTGAGNCDQMAHIANELIRHNQGVCERWCIEQTHAFVVVGKPEVNRTLDFSEPEWADIWICDPWAGITCHAPLYLEQLNIKMNAMSQDNIWINFRDGQAPRWGKANDPVWLEQLNHRPKYLLN